MKFLVIFYFLKDSLLCLVSRLDLLTYSTLHNINFIADTNRNNYGLTFKMPAAPPLSRQYVPLLYRESTLGQSLANVSRQRRTDFGPMQFSNDRFSTIKMHWDNASLLAGVCLARN